MSTDKTRFTVIIWFLSCTSPSEPLQETKHTYLLPLPLFLLLSSCPPSSLPTLPLHLSHPPSPPPRRLTYTLGTLILSSQHKSKKQLRQTLAPSDVGSPGRGDETLNHNIIDSFPAQKSLASHHSPMAKGRRRGRKGGRNCIVRHPSITCDKGSAQTQMQPEWTK